MKSLFSLFVFAMSLFANTNNYPLELYDKVILADAKNATQKANNLIQAIKMNNKINENFEALVLSWKKVQALYIAGELDDSMFDLPQDLDIYHNTNENIATQLDVIIASNQNPATLMFKNSHKSINALEYLLYKKPKNKAKELQMALICTNYLATNLAKIVQTYEKARNIIVKDEKKFNALLLNQLSTSSYELKEWRLGEATGHGTKYRRQPNIKRSEYYYSNLSVKAILTILDAHKNAMQGDLVDFGDIASNYGAMSDVKLIQTALTNAITNATAMKNNLMAPNAKQLYIDLKSLNDGYLNPSLQRIIKKNATVQNKK